MSDHVVERIGRRSNRSCNELGYAQELRPQDGLVQQLRDQLLDHLDPRRRHDGYWLGMVTGGPRVITLGWIIVGFFALLVGMAMGEICSAYPTAGGLYYWSAKLARKNGATWSWFTGWFNLLGQIGVIASVDYALGGLHRLLHPHVRRRLPAHGRSASSCIFLLVLIAHGLLNTFGVQRDQDPRRHQRVVARRRRRDHLRAC